MATPWPELAAELVGQFLTHDPGGGGRQGQVRQVGWAGAPGAIRGANVASHGNSYAT